MIKEYAVEPQAFISSFDSFRFLYGHFGIFKGRVILQFPKRWLKEVYQSCPILKPKQKKIVEVGLASIKQKKKLVQSNRDYNPDISWFENAEYQLKVKPFHAIIAISNPNNNVSVLMIDEITEESPLFCVQRSIILKRESKLIAQCVFSLIKHSKEIIFVDRHFQWLKWWQINPLCAILALIHKEHEFTLRRLQYHTGDKWDEGEFITKLRNKLIPRIPTGMKLEIIRWPEKKLHNRYVLTDMGGFKFGTGLDENLQEEGTEDDDVDNMDEDNYVKRWQKYCDVDYPIHTIEGTEKQ